MEGTLNAAGATTLISDLSVNGLVVGKGAGQNGQNTAIGISALGTGTGGRNTAVGYATMGNYIGTSIDNNSGVGYYNMSGLTSGLQNTSLGAEALFSLTTGSYNTAVGAHTLSIPQGMRTQLWDLLRGRRLLPVL